MEKRANVGLLLLTVLGLAGCSTVAPGGKSSARPPDDRRKIVGAVLPETAGQKRLIEAHARYAAGVVHGLNGQRKQALEDFQQAVSLDPRNEVLALEVAQQLLARNQPDQALAILTNTAAHAEASAAVYDRLGHVYVQLGRLDEAVTANRQVIKLTPSDHVGYQNLYLNLLQKNQPAEALKVLKQAEGTPGADAEFLINLAELFANYARQVPSQKQVAQAAARQALQRAAKAGPPTSLLRLKLADGFNLLGEDASSVEIYRRLLDEFPPASVLQNGVRMRLVEIYVRQGSNQPAIDQLVFLLKDDPANLALNLQLGDLAQKEHQFGLAEDCLRKVIVLRPEFEAAYYELAQAQLGAARLREALATLDQARDKFSASYVGDLLTGIVWGRLKDYDRALKYFTSAEVIARADGSARLNEAFYYQLGSLYERKGDIAQAEWSMRKALELAPNFADAQNFLGYMWAERGTNLAIAHELIAKAIKSEPNNPAFLDSLGWVLYKLNRPTEALPHILNAVKLSEMPDATLLDHLGDVYHALRQPVAAQDAWEKSLAIEPNDSIRKKLDSTLPK